MPAGMAFITVDRRTWIGRRAYIHGGRGTCLSHQADSGGQFGLPGVERRRGPAPDGAQNDREHGATGDRRVTDGALTDGALDTDLACTYHVHGCKLT